MKLKLILTEFEQATLEQLVSYKIKKLDGESDKSIQDRINKEMKSESLIKECVLSCTRWNRNRILLGLPIIT